MSLLNLANYIAAVGNRSIEQYFLNTIIFKEYLKTYKEHLKDIKNDNDLYPNENAEKIVVRDLVGLKNLLDKTAGNIDHEWGSMLMISNIDSLAIIDDIMLDEEIVGRYLRPFSGFGLHYDSKKASKDGYGGVHHFHPIFKSYPSEINYKVSDIDRNGKIDSLNLLTFNINGSPELIAYNHRYTYIPTNDDKSKLGRATLTDIFRYLARL